MSRLATWFLACPILSFAEISRAQEEPAPQLEAPTSATESAPPALTDEARETLELLRSVLAEEGREVAREFLRETVDGLTEPPSGEEASHVALLLELDRLAQELGSLDVSKRLCESRLAIQTRLLPPDHPDLLAAKQSLGATMARLGDIAGARELFDAVLEARMRLLPPDHPDLLVAKENVAMARYVSGDLAGALELEEDVYEASTRIHPPDHHDVLTSKQVLAMIRKELGDLAGARELEEAALEAWTRLLPPDDPDLLRVKNNLALTLKELGDFEGALELQEAVLEARRRLLPADHPELLQVMQSLAGTKHELGDFAGARELEEAVLEARTRLLPRDHPALLAAKQNLAATLYALDDLAGAQELSEAVLEARTRLLPADHPDVLGAKQNCAATRKALGDVQGALELEEAVLEARTRLLPPDHPDLFAAMMNLAGTRQMLGDDAGARDLIEKVLEARTRLLPPDHFDLLGTKLNLAFARFGLGDLAGARELSQAVVEAWTRLLPPDHPRLLDAMQIHALILKALGDVQGARELDEAVLEVRARLLPSDHPSLLRAKQNLANTRKQLGDLSGACELVSELLAGVRVRAGALRAEAPRIAREGARPELRRLARALSLCDSDPSGHTLELLFATLESLRLASVGSSEATQALATRPELAEGARGIAEIRSRLNDLVAAGPVDEDAREEWRQEIVRLGEARDRAERDLRRTLAEAGAFVGEIDAAAVGARLASGSAAVSYLRYTKIIVDTASGDWLLAFVVKPGGAVLRIELGPMAELEPLVDAWRAALGRPLAGRGIGVSAAVEEEESPEVLGQRLRERILDPVLASLGEVRELHVELDDVLHLVPLDALALGDGLVGERMAIRNEVTLARLLRAEPPLGEGELVLAGGVDYDAEPGEGASPFPDATTPPVEPQATRSGAARAGFVPLPETNTETASIAALFEAAFERETSVLSGSAVTKAALFTAVPKARYLHIATHGWFANESFKSQLDALSETSAGDAFARAEATLTGFAPETLCGLALAGANRGKDAHERVPGILTAEELATFDLRNCELAVLSACETNVGIRRAGQGIQSLQTALHAAGARTAITSLWKVDDAATRRLFELFYTKLWQEKLGKADALWQAKMALRAEGYPPRDWAGWVLSGDPD